MASDANFHAGKFPVSIAELSSVLDCAHGAKFLRLLMLLIPQHFVNSRTIQERSSLISAVVL